MNYNIWYKYYPTKNTEGDAEKIRILPMENCTSKADAEAKFDEWIKTQTFGGVVSKITTGSMKKPDPQQVIDDKLKSITITKGDSSSE
jgi:hypothetical protein